MSQLGRPPCSRRNMSSKIIVCGQLRDVVSLPSHHFRTEHVLELKPHGLHSERRASKPGQSVPTRHRLALGGGANSCFKACSRHRFTAPGAHDLMAAAVGAGMSIFCPCGAGGAAGEAGDFGRVACVPCGIARDKEAWHAARLGVRSAAGPWPPRRAGQRGILRKTTASSKNPSPKRETKKQSERSGNLGLPHRLGRGWGVILRGLSTQQILLFRASRRLRDALRAVRRALALPRGHTRAALSLNRAAAPQPTTVARHPLASSRNRSLGARRTRLGR